MRRSITLVLLLCSITPVLAQRTWSPTATRALDSALLIMGMSRLDLAMPPDLLSTDPHRLPYHERSFSDPLRPYDDLDDLNGRLRARSLRDLDSAFARCMADMDLGAFRVEQLESSVTATEIAARCGVDPERMAGFVGATLLYRYLGAVLAASDAVRPAHDSFARQPLLVDLIDSLWMNSKESETATLWQLHDRELRAQERARSFFLRMQPRQLESIYVNGWSLYRQLRSYIDQSIHVQDLLRDSIRTVTITTPIGNIALGGKGNDVYQGTYLFILDVGGDDVYQLDATTKTTALAMPARCIIDLDGNDVYAGASYELGSGLAGIGILIDRAGNDTYRSDDQSMGCGIAGVGILHDMGGDDTYLAGQNTQGCGIFGIGWLLDDAGFDTYRAHAQAQGFGGTRGVGVLDDLQGNDQYLAVSPYVDVLRYEAHHVTFTQGAALGVRPMASGGIGLLFDHAGNDAYTTDIYGQGTAYWFGVGALIDDAGEDRYQAYQYAQGSGVHFASAILRDREGDDVYVSHGVSQGCGHDVATGILLDESGNDSYVCESLSLGGGNANAVSILLDERGNDSYIASNTTNTLGFSDYRRGYGMIGVFVDADGTDVYGERTRNETTSVKSTYGVFADLSIPSPPADGQEPVSDAITVGTPSTLASTPDSLLIQASAAPLRFQSDVKPARQRLIALGARSLSTLADHFGTQMPRVRLAIEEVVPGIHATDPDNVARLLADSLLSRDNVTVGMVMTLAGKIKLRALVPRIMAMTTDHAWQRRRIAVHTLQEIDDTTALPAIQTALADTHAYVRARAAFAMGRMGGPAALTLLRDALADEQQVVRYSAIEGLSRGARRPAADIIAYWRSIHETSSLTSAFRLLAACDTTTADVKTMRAWWRSAAPWQRSIMQRTLPSMPPFWSSALLAADDAPKRKRRSSTP